MPVVRSIVLPLAAVAVSMFTAAGCPGGIRDIETVEAMIDAGADRLGTSKLLI